MAHQSIGPERHHLARQVQDFRHNAKKLKKIFKDTVRVLSDLQEFDESLSIDSILAVQAHKCISNVVSGRTALVVFGETKLRASIVNEILGEVLLQVCVCLKEREEGREREGMRAIYIEREKKREREREREITKLLKSASKWERIVCPQML